MTRLLAMGNLEATLDEMKKNVWEDLFIQPAAHDYQNAGDYFNANCKLTMAINKPLDTLKNLKRDMQMVCLDVHIPKLKNLNWSQTLIEKCPPLVAGNFDTNQLTTGLELQEEIEVEHEVEKEMDVELTEENEKELQFDQCGDVPYYPAWIAKSPKEYKASEWLHKAFDSRIVFLENFLPLERTDHLYKRVPFDKAMPRAAQIHVGLEKQGDTGLNIKHVVIGDVLDAVEHRGRPSGAYSHCSTQTQLDTPAFTYDLRTRQFVDIHVATWHLNMSGNILMHSFVPPSEKDVYELQNYMEFLKIQAQIRFINGEYDGYTNKEMSALRSWLESLDDPEEMRTYFEKTILRVKPSESRCLQT